MGRIDADLIRRSARVLNTGEAHVLDLRGNGIAEIENLDASEDQFDIIDLSDNEIVRLENFPYMNRLGMLLINNNRIACINPSLGEFLPKVHTLVLENNLLTTLAEIDPLSSLPKLQFLSLLDNTVSKQPDYRLYVIHKLKHLRLLDIQKVKQQERIAAAHAFLSMEAEATNTCVKAYSTVQVVNAQDTTKEQGPKVVAATAERTMAIKAAVVNSLTLDEVARLEKVSSTRQLSTECGIPKPDDALAEGDEIQTGLNQENEANENKGERIRIQLEILGTGLDSLSIDLPGQIDEYIYKNFQQMSLKFIYSWRKRPFNQIHIVPPARLQLPGECALHATLALMECHFKVWYASHPNGPREFTIRLSHLRLDIMVREFRESEEGKKLKGRDKLTICLLMAKLYGVVSEEDFAAGCPPEAIRYRIEEYIELSDNDMQMIPSFLEEAEMILSSFRVTEEYRRTLPHDIYRYHPPAKPTDIHDAHCVVLISSGVEFKDPEMVTGQGETPKWERYYEYVNSYDGWGVDGCGYIYHDSLRRSYRIRVADPEI